MAQGISLSEASDAERGFLLDTNAITAIRRKEQLGRELVSEVGRQRLYTTMVNVFECVLEVQPRSAAANNCKTQVEALVAQVLPPSAELAHEAFRTCWVLRRGVQEESR